MKTYNVEGTSYVIRPIYETYNELLCCDVGNFTVWLGNRKNKYFVYISDNEKGIAITEEWKYHNREQAISKMKGLVRKLVKGKFDA